MPEVGVGSHGYSARGPGARRWHERHRPPVGTRNGRARDDGLCRPRLADPVVRSKDISEHVKNIKAEAVRATSIIKNMRMLTEHKPVAHESLSLVEVCHDTIARMKPLAKSKQVKIRFEVRTALVRVHGVKELLETALCNFIINSITALDLANVSRLVTIRILTPSPAETAIQVLDNGIGIPGSIRDKV